MKGMVAIYRAHIVREATLLGGNGEPGFKSSYCPGETGNLGLYMKSPEF